MAPTPPSSGAGERNLFVCSGLNGSRFGTASSRRRSNPSTLSCGSLSHFFFIAETLLSELAISLPRS